MNCKFCALPLFDGDYPSIPAHFRCVGKRDGARRVSTKDIVEVSQNVNNLRTNCDLDPRCVCDNCVMRRLGLTRRVEHLEQEMRGIKEVLNLE